MKIRITLEVDVAETSLGKDHVAGLNPAQVWLQDMDMLWMVVDEANPGPDQQVVLLGWEKA